MYIDKKTVMKLRDSEGTLNLQFRVDIRYGFRLYQKKTGLCTLRSFFLCRRQLRILPIKLKKEKEIKNPLNRGDRKVMEKNFFLYKNSEIIR